VYKALTAWKPQSERDAELAHQFALPKSAEAVDESIAAFKVCEKRFLENGFWVEEDLATIRQHADTVVQYLLKRVREASSPQQVQIMRCCLHMDALHDFKTLYDATMENIRRKESSGFKSYTQVAGELTLFATSCVCPANPRKLIELYNSGRAVYDRFHAFIKKASGASRSGYVYKTHGNKDQPGMKGIYRVLEKGIFKYARDLTGDLDLSKVRDLVRGGIIDLSMKGLAAIATFLLESKEVTVCRVKDRFNKPSSAGWTDCMLNFHFNDDPNKHVCEVQLIHFKMLSQRTTQEGHNAYNIFRAAWELLARTGNLPRARGATRQPQRAQAARQVSAASVMPLVLVNKKEKTIYIDGVKR